MAVQTCSQLTYKVHVSGSMDMITALQSIILLYIKCVKIHSTCVESLFNDYSIMYTYFHSIIII